MLKALAAAEKVARYRHAQLSAVKLAGDINAKVADDASLDELLAKIKGGARAAGVENRHAKVAITSRRTPQPNPLMMNTVRFIELSLRDIRP
jgi:hypothetical protein